MTPRERTFGASNVGKDGALKESGGLKAGASSFFDAAAVAALALARAASFLAWASSSRFLAASRNSCCCLALALRAASSAPERFFSADSRCASVSCIFQ